MTESFPKSRRLLKRSDFLRVQRDGASTRAGAHAVLLACRQREPLACRLGIVASRKVGTAVARNRAKRRIREWFRRLDRPPTAVDLVVILRPSVCLLEAAELWALLDGALPRALRRVAAAPALGSAEAACVGGGEPPS